MTEALIELGEVVAMAKPEAVKSQRITYDELTLVSDAGSIIELLKFLQGNAACQFTTLVDICGVDYPDREQRFEVVYHLLSMRQNHRIRISMPVAEDEIVPSCIELYPAADWFEREVFDMYGVMFSGHPDLRRILTGLRFSRPPAAQRFSDNRLYRSAL